jgi:tRNA(fMet)-specific endonuclease VapC
VTRYLLDSGIASDLINGRGLVPARTRAIRAGGHRIGICTPVLAELVAGIQNSNDPERHMATLWRNLSSLTLWNFDKFAALQFGRLYGELRRMGHVVQFPDLQIAAIAFALDNCVVVSKDSDFRAIPGLKVEDWSV